jgi:ribonucleoside-diphosphate reductase alpha chain
LQRLKTHLDEYTRDQFPGYFTTGQALERTPYDEVQWETRSATIGNDKGAVLFEQRDIEVLAEWSHTASNIVASK